LARATEGDRYSLDDIARVINPYVSASNDTVSRAYRGTVYATASTTIIPDRSPLYFIVGENDELRFLQREPFSWTQYVEQQAKRERRRSSPKQLRSIRHYA
jgi:hypothetical protein